MMGNVQKNWSNQLQCQNFGKLFEGTPSTPTSPPTDWKNAY
jgi:hypothetical protein